MKLASALRATVSVGLSVSGCVLIDDDDDDDITTTRIIKRETFTLINAEPFAIWETICRGLLYISTSKPSVVLPDKLPTEFHTSPLLSHRLHIPSPAGISKMRPLPL